jgi:hypothetical protein
MVNPGVNSRLSRHKNGKVKDFRKLSTNVRIEKFKFLRSRELEF